MSFHPSLLSTAGPSWCTTRSSFTDIDFAAATLVRSNLGGLGGRCTVAGACAELLADDTPHEIFYRDVGRLSGEGGGTPFALRVTNTTEYRAWNLEPNGIKVVGDSATSTGSAFGVINLLGPRSVTQSGGQWNTELTFVELRFAFVSNEAPHAPVVLPRTYITFFDFDTGRNLHSGDTAKEVLQVGPEAAWVQQTADSEIVRQTSGWASISEAAYDTIINATGRLEAWGTPIHLATTYGVGKDNPLDPEPITPRPAPPVLQCHGPRPEGTQ